MPAAPAIVVAVFVLGGLLVAPVSLLMLASVVTFGPVRGGILALAGALASASGVFLIGRAVGAGSLERLLGHRFERVEEVLGRHGIMTVAIARNMPVAPYSVVNLAAGATPLGFWDYFFGTLIGFLPAIVALALLGDRIAESPGSERWFVADSGRPRRRPRRRRRTRRPLVGAAGRPVIRVSTYNVHGFVGRDGRRDPGRIATVIRGLDCDAVGLQEVDSRGARAALDELERRTGMEAVAGSTIVESDGEYGNALLTTARILDLDRHDLSVRGVSPVERSRLCSRLPRDRGSP